MTTRKVSVWYDRREGIEAGWVARCTEYDEDGAPILGRIMMDVPIDADSEKEAREIAAEEWNVDSTEVRV